MELEDVETLQVRLSRGAIPVDEALQIARQICNALEAAHEKGVIHRDLKPGNVIAELSGTSAAAGNHPGAQSLLVAGQPFHRFLCGWRAKSDSSCRWPFARFNLITNWQKTISDRRVP